MDLHLGSSVYSCNKDYKALIGHADTPKKISWLWKCSCQPKHKIFFWLLLQDRLSIIKLFKRRNTALQSYACALCTDDVEESLVHLFLGSSFVADCWNLVGIQVDLALSSPIQIRMSFKT
jgi:hypothetical protein